MLATLVTALALLQSAPASDATLSGAVYDEQRSAIPGADVRIVCDTERRVVTASRTGSFSASGLPATSCSVTASAPLFESQTLVMTLPATTYVSFVLRVQATRAEITVTASRGLLQDGFDVPQSISTTTRADIEARPYQFLPQVLREEPGILVQQTTSAQGSPIIRGFTGQSNVYLLDGVRLNTSAWRSGPSQYFSWVEPHVVERIDIVRGPGSVQYGSDALGGVVNVLTAAPAFSPSGLRVAGHIEAMLGSADRSDMGAVTLSLQAPRAAFRFGLDNRRIDDVRTGGGIDSHAAVTRFLGLPSTVLGERVRDSGFDQTGAYLTGNLRAGNLGTVNLLYMHGDQRDASRVDRLGSGDGLYRSAFEPQTLDFASVRYRQQGLAGFDELAAVFSVNRQADGRSEQTRPTTVIDAQRAVTTSYGYQLEGQRRLGARHRVSVGGELYDESIAASREQTSPLTGTVVRQRPDIPDGTTYRSVGIFAQDVANLVRDRLVLHAGVRYGRFEFATTPDRTLGVTDERVVTDAVTFQAGTVLALSSTVHLTTSVSRGFRAANAADLGSVGLTGGSGFEITPSAAAGLGARIGTTASIDAVSTGQPVPALDPEVLYAYEAGLKVQRDRVSVTVTGFDLEFLDSIQRRAAVFPDDVVGTVISGFTIDRQDARGLAYIAQDVRPVATRVNVDHARVVGVEAQTSVHISRHWDARAYYSLANGRLLSSDEFMRRMPPPMGGAALRWHGLDDRVWAESIVSFAQAQTRLNAADLSDARIGGLRTRASIASYFNGTATDLGLVSGGVLLATGETLAAVQTRLLGTAAAAPLFTTQPGFAALGVRAGWRVTSHVEMTAIGENLTDANYRLYGSGLDAPGANVQLRVKYRF